MRVVFSPPVGGVLRIVFYARYSTDDQNPTSIADQFAACRRFLQTHGIANCPIDEFHDEGISGEVRSRPGIDAVREGIKGGRWNLLVSEESSRLFRNPYAALQLFHEGVDRGLRLICLNDEIDTDEEDWEENLIDAQKSHKKANRLTRKRIQRSFEARWESGYAVTWLRPGYRRVPVRPGVLDAFGRQLGPFVDEVSPEHAAHIHEAFVRVAEGEEPASVGRWLKEKGVPRCHGYHRLGGPDWNAKAVIALIRDRIYIGVEDHGGTTIERRGLSGETSLRRNEKPLRSRPMPHLRIVPDALWQRANAAIDARLRGDAIRPRGANHPLYGIPRGTRTPLSNLFFCGICGSKMYADGRNEGGYRCSVSKKGGCWNRATALREITHVELGKAISAALLQQEGTLAAQVVRIQELAGDLSGWTAREESLLGDRRKLEGKLTNLENALEKTPVERQAGLLALYEQRQNELNGVVAELTEVRQLMSTRMSLPGPDEARAALEDASRRLLDMGRDVRWLLERLLCGPIHAVPFQQSCSNKVVLRARLSLRLLPLLPSELRTIAGIHADHEAPPFGQIDLLVDLFKRPDFIKYYRQAVEAKQRNRKAGHKKIGQMLGTHSMNVHRALQLHQEMQGLGLTETYVELTERPLTASRWRPRD